MPRSANHPARTEEPRFTTGTGPLSRRCYALGQRGYGVSERIDDTNAERFPVVHVQGGSAIRRPLILLAVCAVGLIGYLARDFLIQIGRAHV